MRISKALSIQQNDVVAFTGAGGKTTTLFTLANELISQGLRVVTTTTTRIALDELDFAPAAIQVDTEAPVPAQLQEALTHQQHVFVYSKRVDEQGKIIGVSPEWIDTHLAPSGIADIILIEADGARRLPLKAPYDHEPVVPATTTLVVPVTGLDALGLTLTEDSVYGAEHITRLLSQPAGTPVTPQIIAAILLHPLLGMKNIPTNARVVPLLNKVTQETLPQARLIARSCLSDMNVQGVLIGAVQQLDPILEVRRRIGAIVLAAGLSSRMGEPKVLLPWHDSTIIRHICQQLMACDFHEIVVITGEWHAQIEEQVADLPVRLAYNPEYADGEMLSSLKTGLQALRVTSDACAVVLGDQPEIQPEVVDRLLTAFYTGQGRIVAPSYDNRRGHPIIIDKAFWRALQNLPADGAPRDVIRSNKTEIYHLVVDAAWILKDIDTPEDYDSAKQAWNPDD